VHILFEKIYKKFTEKRVRGVGNSMKRQGLMKWGTLSIVLILAMSLFVVGCATQDQEAGTNAGTDNESEAEQTEGTAESNESDGTSETNESDETKETEEASEGGFPVTLTDGLGQEVTIESEPATIISIVPSNTEITYALGVGDKVVGVSNYDNYPEEVLEKEKVGGLEIDVEKVLSLQPDLLLLSPSHNQYTDVLDQFRKLGIAILVVGDASSFEDVYSSIRLIAKATGTNEKAEEIISDMQERLEELKEKAQAVSEPKKVWVEVSPAPDIYTTGKGTFMHEMLEAIQAINAAGEQEGWVKFTEEEAVKLNPDVIITTYGYYVDNPEQSVLNRAGWAEVPAVKNEQVFDVNNDTVTRPGPRLIDGVETLAKLIYPEIFNQ
jgi:iron complex transport system substrate-binding protein